MQVRVPVAVLTLVVSVISCGYTATTDYPTIETAITPGIFLDLGDKAALPADVQLRRIIPEGLMLTKTSEGWRSRLYNDAAGYCTIGYGHLIKRSKCDGTERPDWQDGITEPEGEALLVEDMADAQIAAMLAVKTHLDDNQYAALCDFVFNVGATNFRKSRLLHFINAEQHEQVADQLRRWVRAGGRELAGLRARREEEIKLYYKAMPLAPRVIPPQGEDLSPIDIYTGT